MTPEELQIFYAAYDFADAVDLVEPDRQVFCRLVDRVTDGVPIPFPYPIPSIRTKATA